MMSRRRKKKKVVGNVILFVSYYKFVILSMEKLDVWMCRDGLAKMGLFRMTGLMSNQEKQSSDPSCDSILVLNVGTLKM